MFGWLKKSDWKSSNPHLELLSRFLTGSSPSEYSGNIRWESVLKEKPELAVRRFVDDGAVVRGSLLQHTSHAFRTPDLKAMLKERGLKVSGRREELLIRLVQHDPDGMKLAVGELVVYTCSETGAKIAEDYIARKDKARADAEQEVKERLLRKDFEGASRTAARFEASQVFGRGLGIDWANHDTKQDVEVLQGIFGETPELLAGLQSADVEPLRLAAALMHLWGTNKAEGLPDGFSTGIPLDANTSARMFLFRALFRRNIAECRRSGISKVQISTAYGSPISPCPACMAMQGEIYDLDSVPALPFKDCTCSLGCRCEAMGIVPSGFER